MSVLSTIRRHKLAYSLLLGGFLLGIVVSVFVSYQLGSTVATETPPATTTPSYLHEEEVVAVVPGVETEQEEEEVWLPVEQTLFEYVEVIDGCGIHFEGECLLARAGPGEDFDVVARLRNDIVLKVDGSITRNGRVWYKVVFDEWLRYPERVEEDWYVAADYVAVLYDEGDKTVWEDKYATATAKEITIDLSEQKLTATENGETFMCADVSTGLKPTPTPQGTFTIFKKTPSRYMQGPLPGFSADDSYDLPGVPWNLYFTQGGAVIHGAYWHDSYGERYSHGCVNLVPEEARKLYEWADLGTKVIVTD